MLFAAPQGNLPRTSASALGPCPELRKEEINSTSSEGLNDRDIIYCRREFNTVGSLLNP